MQYRNQFVCIVRRERLADIWSGSARNDLPALRKCDKPTRGASPFGECCALSGQSTLASKHTWRPTGDYASHAPLLPHSPRPPWFRPCRLDPTNPLLQQVRLAAKIRNQMRYRVLSIDTPHTDHRLTDGLLTHQTFLKRKLIFILATIRRPIARFTYGETDFSTLRESILGGGRLGTATWEI